MGANTRAFIASNWRRRKKFYNIDTWTANFDNINCWDTKRQAKSKS